jgi:hypothetical protein
MTRKALEYDTTRPVHTAHCTPQQPALIPSHSRNTQRHILLSDPGLLGLRVRIPPREWVSVSCALCFQVEASATGRSIVQRTPAECVCV